MAASVALQNRLVVPSASCRFSKDDVSKRLSLVPISHGRQVLDPIAHRPPKSCPRFKASEYVGQRVPGATATQSLKRRQIAVRAEVGESTLAGGERTRAEKWDALTTQLAASSTAAFLVLMLPQILKNFANLRQGNLAPIGVLPWMGYSTGLLGNTLLLSYFAAKKETGATIVQGVGMISTYVLLSTIFFGGFMPSAAYGLVTGVTVLGLALNLLNFAGLVPASIFNVWQDAAGIAGVSVLPQVVYSTFAPTPSFLPGSLAAAAGVVFIVLVRLGKLPESARASWTKASAWTATLLFMVMPVSQLVSNFTNPASVKGLSLATVLFAMAGNGLMIPRALFTRDQIWFTGSTWGTLMQGWACLLSMFIYDAIDKVTFYGVSAGLVTYLTTVLLMDAQSSNLSNPLSSILEVVQGKKNRF